MHIKTRITFKEYLKLLYGLAYRRPLMIVILLVDLVMIVWIGGFYSSLLPVPKPTIYQFITLILITIVQPLVILNTISRNYKSSNHLREALEIELTNEEIVIQGESFFTKIRWEKIFKIEEYKNWFLIYQNTLSAIVIPKKDCDPLEMREFFKSIKDKNVVPVHIKEKNT